MIMGLIREVYKRDPRLDSSQPIEQFKSRDKVIFSQKVEVFSENNLPEVQDAEKTISPAEFFMPEMLE